jgi:hypothetical protein
VGAPGAGLEEFRDLPQSPQNFEMAESSEPQLVHRTFSLTPVHQTTLCAIL